MSARDRDLLRGRGDSVDDDNDDSDVETGRTGQEPQQSTDSNDGTDYDSPPTAPPPDYDYGNGSDDGNGGTDDSPPTAEPPDYDYADEPSDDDTRDDTREDRDALRGRDDGNGGTDDSPTTEPPDYDYADEPTDTSTGPTRTERDLLRGREDPIDQQLEDATSTSDSVSMDRFSPQQQQRIAEERQAYASEIGADPEDIAVVEGSDGGFSLEPEEEYWADLRTQYAEETGVNPYAIDVEETEGGGVSFSVSERAQESQLRSQAADEFGVEQSDIVIEDDTAGLTESAEEELFREQLEEEYPDAESFDIEREDGQLTADIQQRSADDSSALETLATAPLSAQQAAWSGVASAVDDPVGTAQSVGTAPIRASAAAWSGLESAGEWTIESTQDTAGDVRDFSLSDTADDVTDVPGDIWSGATETADDIGDYAESVGANRNVVAAGLGVAAIPEPTPVTETVGLGVAGAAIGGAVAYGAYDDWRTGGSELEMPEDRTGLESPEIAAPTTAEATADELGIEESDPFETEVPAPEDVGTTSEVEVPEETGYTDPTVAQTGAVIDQPTDLPTSPGPTIEQPEPTIEQPGQSEGTERVESDPFWFAGSGVAGSELEEATEPQSLEEARGRPDIDTEAEEEWLPTTEPVEGTGVGVGTDVAVDTATGVGTEPAVSGLTEMMEPTEMATPEELTPPAYEYGYGFGTSTVTRTPRPTPRFDLPEFEAGGTDDTGSFDTGSEGWETGFASPEEVLEGGFGVEVDDEEEWWL